MKIFAILAAAAALLAGGADAATPSTTPSGDTVTVIGTGTVTAVPDQASFSFAVQTKAATASTALTKNGTDTRAVVAALQAAGVPSADIQTEQVSLDPVMSSDGTKIVAYSASDTVGVTKLEIAKAGAVVDAAVGAGATDVSGPSLTVSSQDDLYGKALAAAVANAKSKAQVLAGAAERSLGGVVSIVEGGGVATPLPFGAAKDTGTPIEPGTQDIQATVTVTYALS